MYTIAHAHVYVCVLSHCECTPITSCVGEGAHMYMSFSTTTQSAIMCAAPLISLLCMVTVDE